MNRNYIHPQHNEISHLLRTGMSDSAVARKLEINRQSVTRVRGILGLPAHPRNTTVGDKLDRFSAEPDADGHVKWTGRRGHSGTPVIRHLGVETSAAAAAFERRTGRPPVGECRADCDQPQCMAPDHLADDIERHTIRLQLRSLAGLPGPWEACSQGHAWEGHGGIWPNLSLYCRTCESARNARRFRKPVRKDY